MKRVLFQLYLRLVPNELVYNGWNGNDDPFFFRSNLPACFSTLPVGVLGESLRRQYCLRPAIDELTPLNLVFEDPVDCGGLPLVGPSGRRYTLTGKSLCYTPSAQLVLDCWLSAQMGQIVNGENRLI